MKLIILIILSILSTSCNSQEKKVNTNKERDSDKVGIESQIGEYVTSVFEDSKGTLWFGTLEKGIARFDGLHSNYVTDIEFDKDGSVWFGTRVAERDDPDPKKQFGKGGVNKMMGSKIISFPEIAGFNDGDVYEIYRDKSDNIWISTVNNGVYRSDGETFKHYEVPISIMGMLEDRKGNLWLGGAGGLYRINQNGEIINVTTKGPWK